MVATNATGVTAGVAAASGYDCATRYYSIPFL